MVHSRTVSHTLFVLIGLATAACGASSAPAASTDTTTSSDSALVVSKAAASAKTLTVTSDDGKCTEAFSLVDAHKSDLQALCKSGEVPVPADAVNTDCNEGQVTSITFKCVVAHMPHARPQGCWQIEVKDDNHAIPTAGANQFSALPPVICPMLGGAPPPPPFAMGQGGPQGPGAAGGPGGPGGPGAAGGPGAPGGPIPQGPGAQGPDAQQQQQQQSGQAGYPMPGFPGGQQPQQGPGPMPGQQQNGAPGCGPNVPPPPPVFQCCALGAGGDPNGNHGAPGNGSASPEPSDSTNDDSATK